MKMKKLSPSEPYFTLVLTIEVPKTISITRIEKILRQKPGLKTRILPEHGVELKIVAEIDEAEKILFETIEIVNELANNLLKEAIICLEYWFIIKNIECPCKKGVKTGNRKFCIEKLNGKITRIYCNMSEKYVSIRFPTSKISENLDPIQIPSSAFIKCIDISRLNTVLDIISNDINIVRNSIKTMMNALST